MTIFVFLNIFIQRHGHEVLCVLLSVASDYLESHSCGPSAGNDASLLLYSFHPLPSILPCPAGPWGAVTLRNFPRRICLGCRLLCLPGGGWVGWGRQRFEQLGQVDRGPRPHHRWFKWKGICGQLSQIHGGRPTGSWYGGRGLPRLCSLVKNHPEGPGGSQPSGRPFIFFRQHQINKSIF